MKKLLLLSIAAGLSAASFAQSAATLTAKSHQASPAQRAALVGHKTTAVIHDSLRLNNLGPTDTAFYTYGFGADSGYAAGTNYAGFGAYAERYTFNAADSNVQVLGMISLFFGTVNPASTKNVMFKVWNGGTMTPTSRPTLFFTGFPVTAIDSVSVPYTGLHITDTSYGPTVAYFSSPTAWLSDTFFCGYSTAYDWTAMGGDTITLATTQQGSRLEPVYTVSGGDTIINDVNAFMSASGNWYDNAAQLGLDVHYILFPIVNTRVTLGVNNGIKRNDFTFYGNYPNPAVNTTNIKFALASAADVTVLITDMNGRVINTINQKGLKAGENTIAVETANMAAGNYLYVISTSNGDGIASKLTVIK